MIYAPAQNHFRYSYFPNFGLLELQRNLVRVVAFLPLLLVSHVADLVALQTHACVLLVLSVFGNLYRLSRFDYRPSSLSLHRVPPIEACTIDASGLQPKIVSNASSSVRTLSFNPNCRCKRFGNASTSRSSRRRCRRKRFGRDRRILEPRRLKITEALLIQILMYHHVSLCFLYFDDLG